MNPLKIKLLAYRDADEEVFEAGKTRVFQLLAPDLLEFEDTDPDILFFLTGGSERFALAGVEQGKFYVLISTAEGNANASAMEVKAALGRLNIASVMLDGEEKETREYLLQLHKAKNALAALNNQRLGLIGEVSEWLVASDIKPEILESTLGIGLKKIAWESLPDFKAYDTPASFRDQFSRGMMQEVEKAGKVYALLKETAEKEGFDALTVECFSLVKTRSVSGCLALAKLNHEGIPAACEGDIASAAGMMLGKELIGQNPWMANIAKIGYEKTLLAHCTISPGLVSDYSIKTHFETGVGTAIQGDFISDDITVFRIDETVSRLFVAEGTVVNRPRFASACRTQVEVIFPRAVVDCLRENPLGNHHLVAPGKHKDLILMAARLLNLQVVDGAGVTE